MHKLAVSLLIAAVIGLSPAAAASLGSHGPGGAAGGGVAGDVDNLLRRIERDLDRLTRSLERDVQNIERPRKPSAATQPRPAAR
jgi:hypothetical protein